MPDRKSYPANTSKQRLPIPAEPGRQAVTLEDRDALAKYNASQKPPQSVKAYLQKVLSPGGGSELNTGNGIMGSRAYAPPPPSILKQPIGAGIGVGPGGPAFAAEAMSPGPQAALPAAPVHAAQHGPVQQALAQNLMPEAQPYREGQGARTMAVRQPVPPWAQQQQAAAQNLTGPMGSGYSPGVMTLQARQRAMGQADSMGLPREARAALQQRIQAGDYGAVDRAAQMVAGVGDPRALADSRVGQELARRLLGGQEAAAFDAHKAEQVAHYKGVAQQHAEEARVRSALAQKLGLNPLASESQIRDAQRTAYGAASSKDLQPLAAAGNMAAADALQGQPGPWAGGLNNGVLAREHQQNMDLYNSRYVQPAQIRADGVKTTAELKQQGWHDKQIMDYQIAQLNNQTKIYQAQMQAANVDAVTAARNAQAFQAANAKIIAAGGDPIPFTQFHQMQQQMQTSPHAQPAPPVIGAPGQPMQPSTPLAPTQPQGAQPPDLMGAITGQPNGGMSAQPSPQEAQRLVAGLDPATRHDFDGMDANEQAEFLAWLAHRPVQR